MSVTMRPATDFSRYSRASGNPSPTPTTIRTAARLAAIVLTLLAGSVTLAQGMKPPKLKVRLAASHAAAAPGSTIDIAVVMTLDKPWHMYHPIVLDTGVATEIALDLPAGVSASPWRFPAPELKSSEGIEYLSLEGTFAALTTLTLDRSVPLGKPLLLKASVSGLACIRECVLVDAAGELSLPVEAQLGAAASEDVFKAARAALSPLLAEAPYLAGSRALASHKSLPIGGRGEIAVVVKVESGHHVQDRNPGNENFIPTRLFVESIDGIKFEEPYFPPAKAKDVPTLGKVREQSGEFAIRVPFQITDLKFSPRSVPVRLLLQYQACTDGGRCYPPEMAAGTVEFAVAAAAQAAVPTNEPLFSTPLPARSPAKASDTSSSGGAPTSLPLVFLFAFLGGVILNVMPCVLPVISLKIFSFVQQAGESRGRIFALGLVYTLGILVSFAALAIIMVNFGLAWGGLMQEPRYVMILAAIVFAFSLSLLGVFELRLPGFVENAAAGGAEGAREGYGGAFFNGLMATALATPCVGPFLGSAIGVLIQLPAIVAGLGIMTVGLGLAFPYLLLTAFPAWLRYLPRPGKWMVAFKQLMGFLLVATVIWLVFILHASIAPIELVALLSALLFIAVACWMVGRVPLSASRAREWTTWAAALLLVLVGWHGSFAFFYPENEGQWQAWSPGLPEKLASQGKTVYVDFTATWCLTCQTNKTLVLKVNPVKQRLIDMGVVLLKADFSKRDAAIFAELKKYDKAGVPLNLIYPSTGAAPIVLPEVLTSGIVTSALEQAGPSRTGP